MSTRGLFSRRAAMALAAGAAFVRPLALVVGLLGILLNLRGLLLISTAPAAG